MAYKIANRALMTVSGTPGTGPITLGSAAIGYQTFASGGVANADTVPYLIEDGVAWEVGVGTYSSTGPTLTRTTVLASSNSGAAISVTSSALVMISPSQADLNYNMPNNASATNSVDVRAPIFYDSNNTGYYVDPASTSNFNGLTVAGTITGSVSGTAGSISGLNNPPTNTGGTWPHLVKVNSDGAVEIGRYLDFHNGSADGIDFAVRLQTDGTSTGLTLNGNQVVTPVIYGAFQSWFTNSIDANVNRLSGAYGSYANAATNAPTTSGILYNFTSLTDGSGDGGQFWQDYSTNNFYVRKRWGGGWSSWLSLLSTSNYSSYCNFGTNSVYGGIFYDSNDTGYYCDPAGESLLYGIKNNAGYMLFQSTSHKRITSNDGGGNWNFRAGNYMTASGLQYINNGSSSGAATITFSVDGSDGSINFSAAPIGTAGAAVSYTGTAYFNHSGTWSTSGDFRAPIFYDSNNTGYYVDPASTSNINAMSMAGDLSFGINSGYGINLYGGNTGAHRIYLDSYWTIFKSHTNEGWRFRDNANTDRVVIAGATGQIKIAANPSGWNAAPALVIGYNGDGYLQARHIWGKDASGTGQDTLYLNYATSAGVWIGNRADAPIYYDQSNTGYYVDPASSSNISVMTATGRIYANEWIQFGNYTGLYSPNNGSHFYPNSGSYGSWRLAGSRNGWQGLEFDTSSNGNVSLMIGMDANYAGFHANSYGWKFSWISGALYCWDGTYGGGTQRQVLDQDRWIGSKYFGSDGTIYASIYRDANDGAWYCDPTGTSVLNITKVNAARYNNISFGNKSGHNSLAIMWNGKLYTMCGSAGSYNNATTGRGTNDTTPFWGAHQARQVGFPMESTDPIQVGGFVHSFAFALFANGNLYTWGNNNNGQLGLGDTTARPVPTLSATGVTAVYAHPTNSGRDVDGQRLFIKKTDGYIYGCGYNGYGALGDGTTTTRTSWVQITGLGTNVTNLWNMGASYGSTVVQKSDQSIWVAGNNGNGQLGLGNTTQQNSFVNVTTAWGGGSGYNLVKVIGGFGFADSGVNGTCWMGMLLDNGTTTVFRTAGNRSWGSIGNGVVDGANVTTPATPSVGSGRIADVAGYGGGTGTVMCLKADGTLYAWGRNAHGQCGNGGTAEVGTPFVTATGVAQIFCDGHDKGAYSYFSQSFHRRTDGRLYACGFNDNGYCGLGNVTSPITSWTQVRLPYDAVVIDIAMFATTGGGAINVFLTNDGRLFYTGYNGQHGIHNHSTISLRAPVQVDFLHG